MVSQQSTVRSRELGVVKNSSLNRLKSLFNESKAPETKLLKKVTKYIPQPSLLISL